MTDGGRPTSPDGAWVWDGTQWVPRRTGPDPAAAAAIANELASYPRQWRLAKRGILAIPEQLEPGERVLTTAPGNANVVVDDVPVTLGWGGESAGLLVLVATDRRLALCTLGARYRVVLRTDSIPYGQVARWVARRRSVLVEGAGVRAEPFQMVKGKLAHLRTVVEPLLPPGSIQAR